MRQKATLLSVNSLSVMGLSVTFSRVDLVFMIDYNGIWSLTIQPQLVDVLYQRVQPGYPTQSRHWHTMVLLCYTNKKKTNDKL